MNKNTLPVPQPEPPLQNHLYTPPVSETLLLSEQKIRCVVVDDEPHAAELLGRHIGSTPFLQLVQVTTNPVEVLNMAATQPFDLLFLDVEMPYIPGTELARLLKGKCQLVLCSAHPHYALAGFDLDVCDYLLKPVTYSRFIQAAEKVKQQMALQEPVLPANKEYLLLKGDRKYRHFRICADEIDIIEASGHYIHLYVNGERKTLLASMKDIIKELPEGRFVRVHNSYIVPVNRILYVDHEELGLKSMPHPIPISKTYRPGLLQILKGVR